MDDEILNRLLAAESTAEQIIAQADQERIALIEQAKRAAREAQAQHAQYTAELLASFAAEAEQRAAQTIAELRRRYAERADAIKAAAKLTATQALDVAVALLLGAEKDRP